MAATAAAAAGSVSCSRMQRTPPRLTVEDVTRKRAEPAAILSLAQFSSYLHALQSVAIGIYSLPASSLSSPIHRTTSCISDAAAAAAEEAAAAAPDQRSGGVAEMNEGLRCVIATCEYLLSSVEKAVSPSPAACDLLSESLQQHLEKRMQKVEFRKTHRGFFDVMNDPSKLSTLLEAQIIANRERRREGLDSAAVEELDRKAKGMLLLLLRRESDAAAVLADSAGLLPDPVLPDFQVSPAVLPAFLGSAVEHLRYISRDAVSREVYAGRQGLSLSRDHEHSLSDRRTACLLHSIVSKENAVMAQDGAMVAKDDVRVANDAVLMASHRSSRSFFPTPVKGMRMPLRYLQQRTLPSSLIEAASKVAAREIRARKLHIVERCEKRRDTQHAEKTSNDVVVHSSCQSVVVYAASLRSDGKDTQTESRSIALPDNHSCHQKQQQQQQQQSLRRMGAAVNQASGLLVQVDDAPRSKRQRRKRKTLSEIMSGERIEQTDERLAIEDAQMPQDKRKTPRGKRQPQGSRPALTTKTVPVNAEEASNAPTTEQQHAWEHVSEMNEQETRGGHRISTRSHATCRSTLPDQEKTSVAAEGQGHRLLIMRDVDQDTHTHQRGNTQWNGVQQRSNEKDGAVHIDSAQPGTARREQHSQFIRAGRLDKEGGEEGEYSQAVPVPVPSQEDEIQRQDGECLDSRVACDDVVADKDSCRMGETLHLAAAGKQRSRKRRVGVGTNKNWAVVPDNAKEAGRIAARPEGNESTTREEFSSISVGEKAMITPATVDEEEDEKGEKEPDGQSVSVQEQETTTAGEALLRHSTRRKPSRHDVLEERQTDEKSLKCGSKNSTLSERDGVDVGIEKTTGSRSDEDDNARDHRGKDNRPVENMSTRHLVRGIVDYHRNRGEELIIEDGAPVDHAGTKLDRAWGQTVLGIPIVEKGDRFLSRGEAWRMVKRALSKLLRRDTNAGERSLVEDDGDQ